MWLSHHHPDQHDRCVFIGKRPVCRRCLALWPLTIFLMVLQLVLIGPVKSTFWDLIAIIPVLPGFVDFLGTTRLWWSYSPKRVLIGSFFMAIGLSRLFISYSLFFPIFATMALLAFLIVGLLATFWPKA